MLWSKRLYKSQEPRDSFLVYIALHFIAHKKARRVTVPRRGNTLLVLILSLLSMTVGLFLMFIHEDNLLLNGSSGWGIKFVPMFGVSIEAVHDSRLQQAVECIIEVLWFEQQAVECIIIYRGYMIRAASRKIKGIMLNVKFAIV